MIIVIIGLSATGKTTLANQLGDEFDMPTVHTDDYVNRTETDDYSIADILKAIDECDEGCIVEGIGAIDLIPQIKPDRVYVTSASNDVRQMRHDKRGTTINPGWDQRVSNKMVAQGYDPTTSKLYTPNE